MGIRFRPAEIIYQPSDTATRRTGDLSHADDSSGRGGVQAYCSKLPGWTCMRTAAAVSARDKTPENNPPVTWLVFDFAILRITRSGRYKAKKKDDADRSPKRVSSLTSTSDASRDSFIYWQLATPHIQNNRTVYCAVHNMYPPFTRTGLTW